MTIVPSHLYYLGGIKAKRIPAVLSATMAKAAKFLINDVVYIHNLQHLVKLSSVDKVYLDDIILRRKNEYEHYTVEKKSGGSRFISAP
ncbi:RNA-directed DNA polymerase, partial [Escherichia coli]|nr:RNA-directed DNA polymerase [Escherichia coli]